MILKKERKQELFFQFLFFVLFIFFLLFYPEFIQNWATHARYLVLSVFFSLIFLTYFFFEKKITISISKKLLLVLFISVIGLSVSSFFNNSSFLEERWTLRYLYFLGVLAFIPLFQKESDLKKFIFYPMLCFFLLVGAHVLSQFFFESSPLFGFSSIFFNQNMLAEAILASIPFFYFARKKQNSLLFFILFIFLGTLIFLSKSRSAQIGLIVFCLLDFLLISSKKTLYSGLFIFIFSFTSSFLLNYLKENTSFSSYSTKLLKEKNYSSSFRIEMLKESTKMFFENIFGIGPNKFEFHFLMYRRTNPLIQQDHHNTIIEKSPHNEFLRLLTEEGILSIPTILLLLLALFSSVKNLKNSVQKQEKMFFSCFFYLVFFSQILFQFPTETFFSIFSLILVSSRAFNDFSLSTEQSTKTYLLSFGRTTFLFLFIASSFVSGIFIIRNIKIIPSEYSPSYVKFFPDNWRMSMDYAIEHLNFKKAILAEKTIIPLLKNNPFNFVALEGLYRAKIEKEESGTEDEDDIEFEMAQLDLISCLYYDFFNGKYSIGGSDITTCSGKEKTQKELTKELIQYAKSL